MRPITQHQLDQATDRLNRITGSPRERFVDFNGSATHPGHFYVDKTGTGCQLVRIVNEHGAEMHWSPTGTKRAVWNWIQALVAGYLLAKNEPDTND